MSLSAARKNSAAAYGLSSFDSGGFAGALADAKFNLMWIRYPKQLVARNYTHYMDAELRRTALPYAVMRLTPDVSIPSDPISGIMDFGMDQFRFKAAYDETFTRLLMIMLALRAYKLDHQGSYPKTLGSLTPKYLSATPLDPFADQAPFQYRLVKGGASYLLYSIGPDGIDNGGSPIVYTSVSHHPALQSTDTGDVVAGKDFK